MISADGMSNSRKSCRCPVCLSELEYNNRLIFFEASSFRIFPNTKLYRFGETFINNLRKKNTNSDRASVLDAIPGAAFKIKPDGSVEYEEDDGVISYDNNKGIAVISEFDEYNTLQGRDVITTKLHACGICGYVLPKEIFDREQIIIGLAGRRAEGKTVALAAAFFDDIYYNDKIFEIHNMKFQLLNSSLDAAFVNSDDYSYKRIYDTWKDKKTLDVTNRGWIPPLNVNVDITTREEKKKYQISIYDIAGESFRRGKDNQIPPEDSQLKCADAFICCVRWDWSDILSTHDSDSGKNIRRISPDVPLKIEKHNFLSNGNNNETAKSVESGGDGKELLSYIEILRTINDIAERDDVNKKREVAFTLTQVSKCKDDNLKNILLAEDDKNFRLMESSKKPFIMKELQSRNVEVPFLDDSEKFKKGFFAVSAYDRVPGDGARCIMEPFIWIIKQHFYKNQ